MKFNKIALYTVVAGSAFVVEIVKAQGQMVKMCLFYGNPSGHARSDPIINQQCSSGHVHTFYGPLGFHPDTTYQDLVSTPPELSTSPYVENQSLYWHPSIYEVTDNSDGTETFTRVSDLETSPYYRWDNSVARTEAFPPGFRMIAASDDPGASAGGETGSNMFTECCTPINEENENCQSWDRLHFPTFTCGFLGIAFSMPTCWDGQQLGDTNDHKNHMRYTLNGEVAGPCPTGFDRRLPQIQLFVRINNYKGGKYQLSDGRSEFHVDFFNGWQEGKLQEIIDNCPVSPDQEIGEYNPPCDCTPGEESTASFLTENNNVPQAVCDSDVRRLIIDEATDVTTSLPTDACQGPPLIPKWDQLTANLFSETCDDVNNPPPPPAPPAPTSPPPPAPTSPPPPAPTSPPPPAPSSPPPPAPTPEEEEEEEEESFSRFVICGRGVRKGLRSCPEGAILEVEADSEHEVRCCRDGPGPGWQQKCHDRDAHPDVFALSRIDDECFIENFYDAYDLCESVGGRLCTKHEVLNSCTKGTGCGHDHDLIWTCIEEDNDCTMNSECCSGVCEDGLCMPW